MEEGPVIKVPGVYEKLGSGECGCHCRNGNQVSGKCWASLVVVVLVALVWAFVSLWCLTIEVAVLEKKVEVFDSMSKDDVETLMNFGRILSTHLKSNMYQKLHELQHGINDEEEDPFPPDYSQSQWVHRLEEDDHGNYAVDDIDYHDDDVGGNQENTPQSYLHNDKNETLDASNHIPDKNPKNKTKREIPEYKTTPEKHPKNGPNKTHLRITRREEKPFQYSSTERTPSSETTSTETYFSDKVSAHTSRERFIPETHNISTKLHSHRKHRKSRIGSSERFFTETHSTTTAPIQVRRSRTKSTQTHDTDSKTWLTSNQMLQQHTSPDRDTITKQEAVLRGYTHHIQDKHNGHHLDISKERVPDALSYNMITIHFSADTSHYSRDRDPHYFGNGRMQIKSEVYKDWKPAHWTQGIGMSKYFNLNEGRVTVSTMGIYLIYAQIQYSNVQEVNGFSVFRNSEIVVQCITTSTHPDKQEIKSNTCGISTTILLQSNDSVCIKDLHHGRYVVLTPEKSYFGLVLLSPFKN